MNKDAYYCPKCEKDVEPLPKVKYSRINPQRGFHYSNMEALWDGKTYVCPFCGTEIEATT